VLARDTITAVSVTEIDATLNPRRLAAFFASGQYQ
jgi:hypothetical protein